jgi:Holliday junction resolvase RusA-like endonuclease
MASAATRVVIIEVLGTPAPKGSGRAIMRGGKAQHVPSGSSVNARKLKSWDRAVRDAAAGAVGKVDAPPFVGVPLRVTMVFRLLRPGGHYSRAGQVKPSAPTWPTVKPDGDKLIRATSDTLTGVVFGDDSQIVEYFVRKCYAKPGNEGARIVVERLGGEP